MRNGILVAVVVLAATTGASAQDVIYRFEWLGGGGYTMRGAVSFDSSLMSEQLVLESDVACFVIEGYRDDAPIGRWALGQRTEDTTWQLTFDPVLEQFVVWSPQAPMPQAWNMDGGGYDCGDGGFGFNIGNAAQDLCLDGDLLEESQVPPGQPFPAVRAETFAFPADACAGVMLMGRL